MTIKLKDYIARAVTKTEADKVHDVLVPELNANRNIVLDFQDIEYYSGTFFENSLGKLAHEYGIDRIMKIRTVNMTVTGRVSYLSAMDTIERVLKGMNEPKIE